MKNLIYLVIVFLVLSCKDDKKTGDVSAEKRSLKSLISKKKVAVYLLAGQSNMAGRGLVGIQDTVRNDKLLSINEIGDLVVAQEPLHFYEPKLKGLDCGVSFGRAMLKADPDTYILLLPTAVGGSSIQQWINDSIHRNVALLSNFKEKVVIGKKYGTIKGILWHQGETDAADDENIEAYQARLSILFKKFRTIVANDSLPIVIGELGSYYKENDKWQQLNNAIHNYTTADQFAEYINTQDLKHKGDDLHFDSESQREMGNRYANKLLELIQNQ